MLTMYSFVITLRAHNFVISPTQNNVSIKASFTYDVWKNNLNTALSFAFCCIYHFIPPPIPYTLIYS